LAFRLGERFYVRRRAVGVCCWLEQGEFSRPSCSYLMLWYAIGTVVSMLI